MTREVRCDNRENFRESGAASFCEKPRKGKRNVHIPLPAHVHEDNRHTSRAVHPPAKTQRRVSPSRGNRLRHNGNSTQHRILRPKPSDENVQTGTQNHTWRIPSAPPYPCLTSRLCQNLRFRSMYGSHERELHPLFRFLQKAERDAQGIAQGFAT